MRNALPLAAGLPAGLTVLFTAEVRVEHVDLAGPFSVHESQDSDSSALHSGTMLIRVDDLNYVRFDRINANKNGRPKVSCVLQVWRNNKRVVRMSQSTRDVPTILRLKLYGPELTAAFSQDDGNTWEKFRTVIADHLPDTVDVGVSITSKTESGNTSKFRSPNIRTLERDEDFPR